MKNIAVLLTCYNRREKTLSCLKELFAQSLPDEHAIAVFLVDDGSTDGTGEAVKELYPQVAVIQGSGDLFWNRGMLLAWRHAAETNPDYYLWLNDDSLLLPDALEKLLEYSEQAGHKSIICGAVKSKNGNLTYGGISSGQPSPVPLDDSLKMCECCNGNIVLVPDFVYQQVGNLDPVFHHGIGDFDYGLRAGKIGIKTYVGPDVLGICEKNPPPAWKSKETALLKRIKLAYSCRGLDIVRFLIYIKRHFGMTAFFRFLISTHIRILFPE